MNHFTSGESALILGVVIVYILFTSWLTVRLRSRNNGEFMNAARSMPAAVVGVLLMSEFIGAKSTVGTAQEAFNSGMASAWSVLGASIGFLLFGLFFAKRIYGSGEYTISAAIAKHYGTSTMRTVSIIMMYALLLVNVGNYISGAAALSTVMNLNLTWAMVIIAVVSTFYYVFGGLKGIAYVTILHSGMKLLGIALLLGTALSLSGGIGPMVEKLPPHYFTIDGTIGLPTVFAWVIGTVGAIFSTQFVIQAISSNRSAGEAQRSAFYAAIFCLPLGLMLALIGVTAHYLYPDMKSLYALPVFLDAMHPLMAAIVTTSLVASVFVSVSTVALAIASLMVRDFYVPWKKPTPEQEFRTTRILSLVIGFLPLIFVFFVPEILKLSFFTRALRLSITVVAVIGFFLPLFASNLGATLGLLGATVSTTVWYVMGNPYGIDNMYVALFTPMLVMAVERLIRGRSAPAMVVAPPQADIS
ncbi:sodium:solute symporter family protein [Azospirillum sp. TSO35-2]|uniref:sodium:solute symporter family protein n=1 Tax=Azospirillum sp. TSO35-2 TaxID=716796 RepID=UPI000D6054A1|nr:sodium:solute symporter family protein [Azospirillum sp. TSO35-2]PWC39771.1 sodium:solute symporter [Azospirillum sp. TSO35-2]